MLLKVSKHLTAAPVGRFIAKNPELIRDTLDSVLESTNLNDEQFVGITFAAILAGGSSFGKLPMMISNNRNLVPLLKNLQYHLEQVGFTVVSASWILENWMRVSIQTLGLVHYMKANDTEQEDRYLEISTITDIGEHIEDFVNIIK